MTSFKGGSIIPFEPPFLVFIHFDPLFPPSSRGVYNWIFFGGHPEKDRAWLKMRGIYIFFISLCKLVGYWPIREINHIAKINIAKR